MKAFLKHLARKFGYDIMHLPSEPLLRQRLSLLQNHDIDLIFDIGANEGQYVKKMRALGYQGKIVSFEPLLDAYDKLKQCAGADPLWTVVNSAVGNYDGEAEINVSQNSYSSSLLAMLPLHLASAPDSKYIAKIRVPICKIDTIIDQYAEAGRKLFVKVDTQGYERQVFAGCAGSLKKIVGFQMELSLVPLYQGETLLPEMIDLLRARGYKLMLLESGHCSYATGELLQVEGIFYRSAEK